MALSEPIRAVCREYFGTYKKTKTGTRLVDNRCDSCPLRSPCLTFGHAPARTFDELDKSRETFEREAAAILNPKVDP